MNVHLPGNHRHPYNLNARPVERMGQFGLRVLDEVVVESDHPAGHGAVHLTPDQAVLLLSRLAQLDAVLLHGAPSVDWVINDAMGADGTLAQPVVRTNGSGTLELEQVIVSDGTHRPVVHLSADQVQDLEHQLTNLALRYLHQNVWGGEDARAQ